VQRWADGTELLDEVGIPLALTSIPRLVYGQPVLARSPANELVGCCDGDARVDTDDSVEPEGGVTNGNIKCGIAIVAPAD